MKVKLNPKYHKFRVALVLLILLVVLGVGGYIFSIIDELPSLKDLENPDTNLATQIYSSNNKVLGSLYRHENRIYVRLNEIPSHLKDALISTEDKRYYNHSGVDMIGFTNMFLSVINRVFTGHRPRGGSTITQQLARNLYNEQVGRDHSFLRKLKEMVASVYLERTYTKSEILIHYLNTVPWGGTAYGVKSASLKYFNKDCKDLKPEESALLVALLKGSSHFNPHRYPERARKRRNLVLNLMREEEKITQVECDTLKKKPLNVTQQKRYAHNAGLAPHFRTFVKNYLKQWCATCNTKVNGGKDCPNMYTDGLKVYTTINTDLQKYAEEAVKEHLKGLQAKFDKEIAQSPPWNKKPELIRHAMTRSARYQGLKKTGKSEETIEKFFNKKVKMNIFSWNHPNGIDTVMTPKDSLKYYAKFFGVGMMVMDPKTGYVLAYVGGVDKQYFSYDHVSQGRRQVGSTFKPFVYISALSNGFKPCKKISNDRVSIQVGDGEPPWTPKNADGVYGGTMTMRDGLAHSVNVVTARVISEETSPQAVLKYARRLGIKSHLAPVYSMALGVFDLNVAELTSAYAAMANQGIWNEPVFITRIEDRFGNVLESFQTEPKEAISKKTAYLITDLLQGVVQKGTAASLLWKYKLPRGLQMAGKTGTTQKNSDGWFMGYTPELAAGVWVGCDDRNIHFRSTWDGQGATMALPIWGKFMSKVYNSENTPYDARKSFAYPHPDWIEKCAAADSTGTTGTPDDTYDPYLN